MIKVLVVDDSAFMRKLFSETINSEPDLQVIDTARHGTQALKKIEELNPDIITLDIEMPKLDGLETLKILQEKYPCLPVLMVSALDNRDTVMKALDIGAFDFIPKPSGSISLEIDDIERDLIEKIKAGAESSPLEGRRECQQVNIKTSPPEKISREKWQKNEFPVIAMGASSGGPRAIKEILGALPANLPAGIAIVQHMPAGFTTSLAERLDKETNLNVKEAENGDKLKPDSALLAPGDYHMTFTAEGVNLDKGPKRWGVRPCVDHMMASMAPIYKDRIIGVILTGMGSDGGEGMKAIKKHEGYGIVEAESSALVYGMPRTVIKTGAYDEILPRSKIPQTLVKLIERSEV